MSSTAVSDSYYGHELASNFPQLPPEIWYTIAKYIETDQLPKLYSLNSTFLDIAASARYREVSATIADIEHSGTRSILDHAGAPFLAFRVKRLKLNIETICAEAPLCLSHKHPNPREISHHNDSRQTRTKSLSSSSILPYLKRIFSVRYKFPISRSKSPQTDEEENGKPNLDLERFPNLVELQLRVDPRFIPCRQDYDSWQPIVSKIYDNMGERLRSLIIHDLSSISTYYPTLLPDRGLKTSVEFPVLEELVIAALMKSRSYDPLLTAGQSITLTRYGRFIQSTKATLKKLSLRFTTPMPVEVILNALTEPFDKLTHVEFYMPHNDIWESAAFTDSFRAFLTANTNTLRNLEFPSFWCRPDLPDLGGGGVFPPVDTLILTGRGYSQMFSFMLMLYCIVHGPALAALHLPNMELSFKKLDMFLTFTLDAGTTIWNGLTTFEVSVYSINTKLFFLLAQMMPNLKHLIVKFTDILADPRDEDISHHNRQATTRQELLMFAYTMTRMRDITNILETWSLKTLEIRNTSGVGSGLLELLVSILRNALIHVNIETGSTIA